MPEFTGERLIPGQVEVDLFNEHLARYAFAGRLAAGKRVLDAGCGTGYGSAELARLADSVVGADIAPEAVDYAREHYRSPNLQFEQASCTALPHPPASFDLVVAFEVIEHLADWREMLREARRLLAPGGQFIVSTPNRLYYTESRGESGANPFHVHEFDFDEFRRELAAFFPHVTLFLENHVEGIVFQPCPVGNTSEVRVDSEAGQPAEAHFFLAVCAHRPQLGNPTFVYVPQAANVLRERERHIALLQQELATKNEWLAQAHREHDDLVGLHRSVTEELERSNEWAKSLDAEIAERRTRIVQLQDELRSVTEGYAARVKELETDIASITQWARDMEARLEQETSARARLEQHAADLQHQVNSYRGSRWVKLGRKFGLGPDQPAS
ncbi:MAG TPA: methyltransferase domain-containing protein [Bryobacteraceae bacterium]